MTRVIVKFNLAREDDKFDYEIYKNAYKMYLLISQLTKWLRDNLKYENLSEKDSQMFDMFQRKLVEFLNENNITIEF